MGPELRTFFPRKSLVRFSPGRVVQRCMANLLHANSGIYHSSTPYSCCDLLSVSPFQFLSVRLRLLCLGPPPPPILGLRSVLYIILLLPRQLPFLSSTHLVFTLLYISNCIYTPPFKRVNSNPIIFKMTAQNLPHEPEFEQAYKGTSSRISFTIFR